jgi:hypothetical protein
MPQDFRDLLPKHWVEELVGSDLQCQANLFERDKFVRGIYPEDKPLPRCICKATVSVDDAYFCRRHAAYLLLELHITEFKDAQERTSREA